MRRLVSLALALFCAVPFGISVSGCSKTAATVFCNGGQGGQVVGQTTTLDLEPRLTGISLNEGQIGQINAPSAKDCRGNGSSAAGPTYASTDLTLLDLNPATGRLCAGTWNRNTGGGIADFTTCTPNGRQGTAFVTASAQGVTSNAIPVFIHPIVTSILLGLPSTNCTTGTPGYDPASNCFSATNINSCVTPAAVANPPIPYTGAACVSQNSSAQLAARTYTGADITNPANNVSCFVGPLTFTAQNPTIVTIDQTGLATAAAPGSTIINASLSQSSSSAGFFATCPPQNIILTTPSATAPPAGPVTVNQNTAQSLVALITDTLGAPITNITLNYVSTTPTVIPAAGSIITPTFPGAAAITAICEPPNCNPSAYNQIGLFNTGTPVTSNSVQIVAPGTTSSTILYIASTQSQYLQPIDFTVSTQSAPIRLPYAPNSMVLSEDLTSLYMGTPNEIMVLSASISGVTLARQDTAVAGYVLAVSPDNGTVVITDPTRNLVYLYNAGGGIASEYGGTGIRAQWSPDSQVVYITTTDGRMLVHSTFTGWTSVGLGGSVASDVAITVPDAGVYLGNTPGNGTVTGRTNCPATTVNNTPGQPFLTTTSNVFYPLADSPAASASRLAATNDGVHILGASPTNFLDLTTNAKAGACPVAFTSAVAANPLLAGIAVTPTAALTGTASVTGGGIVDVLPTSDSAFAFLTFTGTGGVVPQFNPATLALTNIPLQTTAAGKPIAPVRGVISSDNLTLFVGTTGDNLVHRLTRGASGFSDTVAPIAPALPNINGPGTATPDLIVQRPRKSTS